MTSTNTNAFTNACSDLIGQVAVNPTLADSIVTALASGQLTTSSGPMSISNVLKGSPGSHHLKEFLCAWKSSAPHLGALDVGSMVKSALTCYRLAQARAHTVDAVWTGPELSGSEVRRTEAVVSEIVAGADMELLIVGYWLVTSTVQIKDLFDLLIKKARSGVKVRFVFDPAKKFDGPDNFAALNEKWPSDLKGVPREVFSWSEHMTKAKSKSGHEYDRKLHAKVIVGDRHDALITSANLTHAGLLENLEMGFRVQGVMAGAVVRHFDLLIEKGILERWT